MDSFSKQADGASDNPDSEQLQATIVAFISAASLEEAKGRIYAHPELLSEQADTMLEQAILRQGDATVKDVLVQRRAVLIHCRRDGVDATLGQMLPHVA